MTTVDTLLKFLYEEFAVTFAFCVVGALIKEMFMVSSTKESKRKINLFGIILSSIMSTLLMCALTKYTDLPFEVYAIISVICGIWGKSIIKILVNENFVRGFAKNVSKTIADPIVKAAAESAIELLEDEKEKEKKDSKSEEDESKEDEKDKDPKNENKLG